MNKRIEELAEQATEEMDQEAFSEDMNIPAEWYQKFAELIVRDCAKNAVLFADSAASQGLPSKYIENYMLHYFGVNK